MDLRRRLLRSRSLTKIAWSTGSTTLWRLDTLDAPPTLTVPGVISALRVMRSACNGVSVLEKRFVLYRTRCL